jgi:hypothetical protein
MSLAAPLFFKKEIIDEIFSLYLNGASVYEIADYFNIGDNKINEILDRYSKYLE